MLGHRVDSQTNSYFKTNLPELKETYIQAIPFISIENTEVKSLETQEYKELQKLKQAEIERKNENNELRLELDGIKTKLAGLGDLAKIIDNPKVKKVLKEELGV